MKIVVLAGGISTEREVSLVSGTGICRALRENGHRAIAFVGDINSTDAIADRYYGYRKALNENRINFLGEWHVNYNLENNQGVLNFNFVEKKITAVVCHCDACAQKIYNELALKGQKIPDDISVVSFDDTSLCDNLIPKLTSIGAKKEVFAQKALNAMIELINTKKHPYIQIRLSLSEQESVKKLQND